MGNIIQKTLLTLLIVMISTSLGQSIFAQDVNQDLIATMSQPSLSSYPNTFKTNQTVDKARALSRVPFGHSSTGIVSAPTNIDLIGEEHNYFVGPGDQLTALILTTKQEEVLISITSSGHAVIPNAGVVETNGLSLADAQDTISSLLKRKFRNADIIVFLTTAKKISVPVYGEVTTPGVYTVNGTTRITELIALAGGLTADANPRTVEVSNDLSNSSNAVDLYRAYRIAGEKSAFVQSGDNLFISPKRDIVTLSGAVNFPLEYDYIENETVADIIATAGGFTRDVDSTRILVTRFINDRDSIVRFELDYDLALNFILQEDDYIFVPEQKDYRITRQVTISGEVAFPGRYAVREDKTRLIDLIKLAGDLTDDAYLAGSRIERTDFTDAGASEFERLRSYESGDMSPEEWGYLKYRGSSLTGRVSIDFVELIEDGEDLNNIILRNGDEIHIARRGLSVNVMGAVVKPGLIVYQEGENLSYYINQAGGLQDDAERRRIKVIKGGSEIWLEPRQVESIEVGDAIWIPEEPYRDKMKNTRDILAIVSGTLLTIGSIFGIITFAQTQQDRANEN